MSWPSQDTPWWILGVAVASVAACGSTSAVDDGKDTDTDGTTGDSTGATTSSPECLDNTDCPSSDLHFDVIFVCIDQRCVPVCAEDCPECETDEDCLLGERCDSFGTCTSECNDHGSCEPGELCQPPCDNPDSCGLSCEPVELVPECAEQLTLLPFPVEEGNPDPIAWLSFVDADGDDSDDLVVGHDSESIMLYPGVGAPSALPFPEGATSVTSGDFDGDGVSDLVSAHEDGQITILSGDGLGGFVLASTHPEASIQWRITTLDWNADGALDLAGLFLGRASIVLGDGMGGLGPPLFATGYHDPDLEVGSFGSDDADDIAMQGRWMANVHFGNGMGDLLPDGELSPAADFGPRALVSGDFVAGSVGDEIVGYTMMGEWILLDTWRNWASDHGRLALIRPAVDLSAAGDFDGSGGDDAMLVSGTVAYLLRGAEGESAPMFTCMQELRLPFSPSRVAVGDLDGNGVDDLAIANASNVVVLLSQ